MANTYYTEDYTDNAFYYWVTSDTTTGTANGVWDNWNTTSSTTCTNTASGTNYVWESWHNAKPYRAAEEYNIIWRTWNDNDTHKPHYIKENGGFIRETILELAPIPKLTTEQRRAVKVQTDINKIWRDIRIQEEKERKERAELTALQLLEDLIDEQSLRVYKETGKLVVKGKRYDYVLNKGSGVYKIEKDKIVDLCIHLRNRTKYPETDNIISLKLLIEGNESRFLRTANNHGHVGNEETKNKVIELVRNHNMLPRRNFKTELLKIAGGMR